MTELIEVARPDGEPKLNVVFVHGLGGDARKTWAYEGEERNFWPCHLANAVQGIATYSLDYDASPTTWLSKAMSLPDRASNVLPFLIAQDTLRDVPLVFICHNLGGLVVKQMLLQAVEQGGHSLKHEDFIDRVRGVGFLATPHSGSDLATYLKAIKVAYASPVAQDLSRNNGHLLEQRRRYQTWAWGQDLRHLVIIENKQIMGTLVVEPDSADPVFPDSWATPVDYDHFGICKPMGGSAEVHVLTCDFLRDLMAAPARGTRAAREDRVKREVVTDLARQGKVDPGAIDVSLLEPIFAHLGQGDLSPEEMHAKAREAIAALLDKAKEKVEPGNEGADIDAAVTAARAPG